MGSPSYRTSFGGRPRRVVRSLPLLLLLGSAWLGCAPDQGEPPPPAAGSGERLAQTHCGSCHAFPEPGLLSRAGWDAVLPDMGAHLGIYDTRPRDSLIQFIVQEGLDPAPHYPVEPRLSPEAWAAIVDYYHREAPDVLPLPPRGGRTAVGLPGFEVRVPTFAFSTRQTTMVQVQSALGVFLVGNLAWNSQLVALDAGGRLVRTFELPGAPVAAHTDGHRLLIAVVGKIPGPTEAALGSIHAVDGPEARPRPIITGLKRPVDFQLGDLNGDGRTDLVVCEYGHRTGFLSWYESTGDGSYGTYRRHVLAAQPGAAQAALRDFDGDGRLDVAVLMAQGDEGVDIYYNQGEGRFRPERVLRFPPVYGSTDLDVADLDGDGHLDLVTVHGDNADYTRLLKPYHGVRLFLNDGAGTFDERAFLPLHGATAARAADFDGDGDVDVAAIAFFADYAEAPEEGFVLFQNAGDFRFRPYTFAASARGRWLTLDAGDIDGDGDRDLVIGSNTGLMESDADSLDGRWAALLQQWREAAPSFLVLENTRL